MKNFCFFLFCLFLLNLAAFAQIKVQFITVNDYGNNLYIDNITMGNQFLKDVGVISINNIKPDSNFAVGTTPFIVAPKVTIANVGKTNIAASFNVVMTVTPGTYSSTKSISSLNAGNGIEVEFDNLTITPGQPINITVTSMLSGDENQANNVLNQYTAYFPGVQRKVLLEQFTSSTCGPCASNNPTVDAFVTTNFASVVAVKYHMNWPSPGNDPMYAYNPTQATDRRSYYGVNSVPHIVMDGVLAPSYPYTQANSLPDAYNTRSSIGSPLSVSVTQTRLTGDTIKADVSVQIFSNLPAGNYYLRVHAIERVIKYVSAPGSNGEKDFYDVFRKAYPNSLGTTIPTTVGTHTFSFKYKLDLPTWVDSLIYTVAFVQKDATKEVINCGKSRNYAEAFFANNPVNDEDVQKPIASEFATESFNFTSLINTDEALSSVFAYSMFEDKFPPAGWSIKNPDGALTFEQYNGANGPSFFGNKSVTLNFYSYSTANQSDTLISNGINGLLGDDTLKFDYAHAQYNSTYSDRLIVRLSNDNGLTYPFTIFNKAGADLATAPATTGSFVPTSPSQWKTFSYPLAQIVPVELTSFTAVPNSSSIELNWITATEKNNHGFEVQKLIENNFVTIGFVTGKGTSLEENSYSFIDKNVIAGKYSYRLKQVDFDGKFMFSDLLEVDFKGPQEFALLQNYPNPFNPSTSISFSLAEQSDITLKVFNILGKEVATLVDENKPAGTYTVSFNASNLASGIYFIGMKAGSFSAMKKISLIK